MNVRLMRYEMRRGTLVLSEAEAEAEFAWNQAEKALVEARRLPVGAERVAALREAGRMRFRADNLRREAETKPQSDTTSRV
jgi:hypothetical protein